MTRVVLGSRLALAVYLSITVLLTLACEKRRQPVRYLVPEGFVGWVLIQLSVDDAPSLREESGFLVVEVPQSGKLSVPGTTKSGWAQDEYFYDDGAGRRERLAITPPGGGGLVWGVGVASYDEEGGASITAEHFFVGPEIEFSRAPKLDELLRSWASESRTH